MRTLFNNAIIAVTLIFSVSISHGQSDNCSPATTYNSGALCVPVAGSNAGSTTGPEDSYAAGDICALSVENTIWYTFTAPIADTYTVTWDVGACASGFGLQTGVLTGPCGGPYTSLNCSYAGTGVSTSYTFVVGAGQQVWLIADGDGGDQCPFNIDICGTACNADVGTFQTLVNGVPTAGPLYMCPTSTDCINLVSNNDFVLPPAQAGELSELMWALYTCPPTTGDPATDPCYSGSLWSGQDFADCNPSTYGLTGTWYFVPITADDGDNGGDPNGVIHYDQNGDGCFDLGTTSLVEITYLNAFSFVATPDPCDGTVDVVISGGLPEADGSNYTLANTGLGVLTGAPVSHGGTITITGLTNGDGWSFTIDDGKGCATVIASGIYVADAVNPTITCPGNQVGNVDGSCNFSLPDYTGLATAADNCPGVTVSQVPAAGTIVGVGTTNVVLTATDFSGNTANCNFDVVVTDATNPTITCPGNQVGNVDASCNFSLPDYTGLATPADNCPGVTVSQVPAAGTIVGVGTTNIVLTATDGSSNTANCNFDVVVSDAINPNAVCQNINAYLDGAGNVTIVAADIDGGSTDNCPGLSLSASQTAFTCADIGANNVTLTATDGATNTDNCIAVVTVIDTISPTITCPGNQTENPDASCNFTLPDYTGLTTPTDNCGGTTVTQSPIAGTVISGTTTITMTVDDGNGNSSTCTFDVILNDATPPTAVCQNISIYLDGAGNATIVGADLDGGSTDNCAGLTFSASQTAFTCADIGPNNVTMTATDGNSNTANCVAVVTVLDTVSPTAVCQNINAYLDGAGNVTIVAADIDGGSTDNCGAVTLGASITAFTCADIGANNVTLTVTDGSANTDVCVAVVTVLDTVSPSAVCQNINAYLDGAGNVSIVAADIDGGSTDNCATITLSASATAFTCADIGPNNVTLTVTDGNANTDVCVAVVTVMDTTSPTAVCQNINAYLDGAGNVSIVAADIDGGSTDNCSTVTLGASTTAFTCADIGANNVTLTATDGSANTDICVAVVTVLDTVPPAITCPGPQVEAADALCQLIVPDYTGLGSATDNCTAVPTITQSPAIGSTQTGAFVVTLTADDGNGNVDSCSFNVSVNDTVAPTITCPVDQNDFYDATCSFTVIDYTGMATTSDNCGSPTVTQSPAIGSVQTGNFVVTLTADDGNGNSDSCAFNVNLSDSISPVIICPADQTVNGDASCQAIVIDYTAMGTATDNCTAFPTITQSPAVGSTQTGNFVITLTADDGNGNSSSCTFNVVINDSINPTITCPADQAAGFDATCSFTLLDYTSMATAADNCGTPTVTQSPAAGTVVTGNTTITLTAVDGNGNTDSCSFNLTLSDVDAPVVSCSPDESIYLDANCEVTLPDYMSLATVADNCDASPTITQSPAVGTMYTAPGSVTVTVVATDASGNADSCSLVVTIDVDANSGCGGTPIICDILTPNGDGKNDTWIIKDPVDIVGCTVSVYNRWGQQVYETIDYNNTWDGTSNGAQLPDGAYYYIITCDGEITYKGDLSILRLKK